MSCVGKCSKVERNQKKALVVIHSILKSKSKVNGKNYDPRNSHKRNRIDEPKGLCEQFFLVVSKKL